METEHTLLGPLSKPRQGRMSRQGKTTFIAILAGVCCALAPATAGANSLLSGYGGPGEGNQAILGSALLNGPSGGGGSAGSPPAGEQTGAAPADASSVVAGAAAGARRSLTGATRSARRRETVSAGGSHPGFTLPTRPTSQSSAVAAPALGLSGQDFMYILLAVGALVCTGALTRQLARRP
jgi:hypothetical protein